MRKLVTLSAIVLLASCVTTSSVTTSPDDFVAHEGCACGSTDPNSPCTGNFISVTVKATLPDTNEVNYEDANFQWRFSSGGGDAYCGKFANGDYWIAPKGSTSVQIHSVSGNGSITVDDDPVMEEVGLLDGSKNYGNHASENNLVPKLPVSYSRVASLVAAKQRNEAADGHCGTRNIEGECVDAYNVVTVLTQVPANLGADMIRPNISGNSKVFLTLADFDLTRLPQNDILRGAGAQELEEIRQRWSHSTEIFGLMSFSEGVGETYSEGGRAFRSHIVIDDYGSGMAVAFNSDLMTVFSDDNPVEEKWPAIAAMLSYGLDIYHARYNPPPGRIRGWVSGAGQSNGKFLPAVFLAALMRDSAYAAVLRTVGPDTHAVNEADRGPAELRQFHSGNGGVYIWGDEPTFTGDYLEAAYWGSLLKSQCYDGASGTCTPNEYGKKTQRDPYGYIDGPPNKPGWGYAEITAGVQRDLVAAMFQMPEICNIVNYPPLIQYVDRLVNVGAHAIPDVCAPPDPLETATCEGSSDPDCVACSPFDDVGKPVDRRTCRYYGVTWGPDPGNPGQCIGGAGRFTALHHSPLNISYMSRQVRDHWAELRGAGSYCE